MRLSGMTKESLVDGPGLRFVLFTQGCPHHCPHCHNPESWANEGGQAFSVKEIVRLFRRHKGTKRGITFSGGEPFLFGPELAEVATAVHAMGMDVVTYTGFTYEQLIQSNDAGKLALLAATDILVDGQYVHNLRDISLRFCGSSNQRVIDMAATNHFNEVTIWHGETYTPVRSA